MKRLKEHERWKITRNDVKHADKKGNSRAICTKRRRLPVCNEQNAPKVSAKGMPKLLKNGKNAVECESGAWETLLRCALESSLDTQFSMLENTLRNTQAEGCPRSAERMRSSSMCWQCSASGIARKIKAQDKKMFIASKPTLDEARRRSLAYSPLAIATKFVGSRLANALTY